MTKILMTRIVASLLIIGCADKNLTTTNPVVDGTGMEGTNPIIYENVDPVGQGIGQGNGSYGNGNGNGINGNGTSLRNSGKVKLEGHCDASGSDEYNYALGLKRAKATKDALIGNGMSATQITLVSMGESSPECTSSSSSACYAKNRRVEFQIMR